MNSILVTTAHFDLDTGAPIVTLARNYEEVRRRPWMSAEEALVTFSALDGCSIPLGAVETATALNHFLDAKRIVKTEWLARNLCKHEYVIVTQRQGTADRIRVVSRRELRATARVPDTE